MTYAVMLCLLLGAGLLACLAAVFGIVHAFRRRWRAALWSVAAFGAAALCGGLCALVLAGLLGIDGWRLIRREAAKIQAIYAQGKAENAAHAARAAEHIALLKSYVDTDTLKTVDPEFYEYDGFRDWWRFPLVYPYAINMVDTLENGGLVDDRGRKPSAGGLVNIIIRDITALTFDEKLLVVRVADGNDTPVWVVFEFATRGTETFASEADALTAARRRGFAGSTTLESVETHYHLCF